MLQAYEGYFEDGQFYPIESPMRVQGRCRVILTVLEESASEQKECSKAKAWREFFATVNASDEKIPVSFKRVNFT